MIAICTGCQAKFRVADERVGPRGAKIRCSKCQMVFVVHRGQGPLDGPDPHPAAAPAADPPAARREPRPAPPALDLDLERGRGPRPEPFGFRLGPSAASATASGLAEPDPPDDPFSPSDAPRLRVAARPYARDERIVGDPFGDATAGPRPSRAPAHAARADDPFEAPAPAPAAALDAFLPAAARSDGELRPDLRTDLSELLDDAPAPPAAAPPSPADALSLEERTTPAPSPLRRAGLDAALAIADPFAAAGPDASEKEPTFWEVLPDPPVPRPPRVAAVAVSAPGRERGERGPAVALAPAARRADAPREGAEERPRPRAPSWLRSIAANALSLAVLLAVAIGLLAVWRGGVAAAALRPAALLAAVVGGDAGPFRATSVSNGFYERARGAPLLFVRGRVVSSAPAAVEGVKVSVEIVRGGAVLARGEAWAGALPSPEELWSARDGAAPQGDAVPHALAPGQALPFVVAVPDAPPEVEGAEVRIALRAQPYSGRGARR